MALSLNYWNGRGLMEIPRKLLAIAGKFPGEGYTDGRFDAAPEGLEQNLGRMPVIRVGDDSIGQSAAINFYIASEHGLLGSSNLEAARIISISEHLKEMNTVWSGMVPFGTVPSEEILDKWFNQGATDSTGTADRAGYSTRFLTWWLGRIEGTLDSNGFAVGNKLSLADVLLHNAFGEVLREEERKEGFSAARCEPFGSKARVDEALSKHPKIAASVAAVASNENVQKFLSMRGVQSF